MPGIAAVDIVTKLGATINQTLAEQLIEEARKLEESFLLKRWQHSELNGGRLAEVAARIIYSVDSGNVSLTKSVDDCLKYIDNNQVTHNFPEPQAAIHMAKVLRSIYKMRSQRGAVHVSPTYTANEIDSRLIIESARWILAELLRLFVAAHKDEVASMIKEIARFPNPLIRAYEDIPLLQSVGFTIEEEILAHLIEERDGMTIQQLITIIPRDQSSVRRAASRLATSKLRQVVKRSDKWLITDLGIERIEHRITTG